MHVESPANFKGVESGGLSLLKGSIPAELATGSRERWLRFFRYAPQGIIFSPVQQVIAQLVTCGLSDKEIAYLLGIACSTVKVHTGKILKMLGLNRRAQLVRYMIESGRFDPDTTEEMLARRWLHSRLRAPQEGTSPGAAG